MTFASLAMFLNLCVECFSRVPPKFQAHLLFLLREIVPRKTVRCSRVERVENHCSTTFRQTHIDTIFFKQAISLLLVLHCQFEDHLAIQQNYLWFAVSGHQLQHVHRTLCY